MDFEKLLELQDVDTRIAQLEHRRAHDPTHAALAAAIAARTQLDAEAVALFAERDAVRQEQQRFEDEAASIDEKIAKDNATLYGGTVTSPKELESLQHELAVLKERRDAFDESALEQMELAEPLDARAAELDQRRSDAADAVASAETAVTIAMAEVGAELDAATTDRATIAEAIDEALLAQYERIRASAGGQGVARLGPGGRCEGCHLTLPRVEFDALKHAPAGEVHLCPECGRILVR